MAQLSLTLLGNFAAALDKQPLSQFRTNKVQALLIYLVVEASTIHQRELLMELLWPGLPQKSAQVNLRQILYQLNRIIPQHEKDKMANEETAVSLLISDRKTIQLHPHYPVTSDVNHLTALLHRSWQHHHNDLLTCPDCRTWLAEAVTLYQGDFLADFSLYDSNSFEAWSQVKRESLRRQTLDALDTLTHIYLTEQDYQQAEQAARRQLTIDNLRENAYRQLMQILALTGRRSEAIALYKECQHLLTEELGMSPAAKTTALSEQIKGGSLSLVTPIQQGIRGYEMGDKLGEGAFGVVYKAHQKGIGREVAIKIIHAQYANKPDFIRRFEAEAQIVARLEHPHIVPLYDYWREADGAYLVMRWLRGGSLQASLENELFAVETAVSLITQIANALHTAHRHGIIHRDVKPANILLDEEGNAYLTDFGIARDTTADLQLTRTHELVGSPNYISPEQLLGEEVTPMTDIYCLGLVLYKMLTGSQPYSTTSMAELIQKQIHEPLPSITSQRPDLPAALDDIIQQATAKKANERFSDTVSFAAALHQAVSDTNGQTINTLPRITTIPEADIINPYKGLHAFQERDAEQFYGRQTLIKQLLAQLNPKNRVFDKNTVSTEAQNRFLTIVGPSGSGKSSVVKAGLIPALRKGALPGSEDWFIVEMTPGSYPLEELEAALLHVAVNPPPSLLEPLQKDERGLARVLKRLLPQDKNVDTPSQLLLVIDQFEELFTLVQNDADRTRFLDNLFAALTDAHSRLWVIITLRADFYDRPLQMPQLGEWMRHRTGLVLPLTVAELEQAITAPASSMGISCEPGLVSAIITDVKEQPGALPLMQYALTELFERRNGRNLTLATYQAIDGVTGALARRAEEIYNDLDAPTQEVTRQLFLRLITLGEGVEDTRRRVLISELMSMTGVGNNNQPLTINNQPLTDPIHNSSFIIHPLEAFGKHRLLTFDHDPISREATVEVAHEALLREWPRLRNWLVDSREDVRRQRLLAEGANHWGHANHDNSYLLRGSRLIAFESWREITTVALTANENDFLQTSIAARNQRHTEEEARRQRELETAHKLAEEQTRRAEEQTQAAKSLRQRAVFLAGVTVLAVVLAVAAFGFARASTNNANLASTREGEALTNLDLAATNEADAITNANLASTREAEAGVERDRADGERETAVAEAEQRATAVANALDSQAIAEQQQNIAEEQRRLAVSRELSQVAASVLETDPELSTLLALEAINTTYTKQAEEALHNALQQSRTLMTLSDEDTYLLHAIYTPDGSKLVIQATDTIELWDAVSGDRLNSAPFKESILQIRWRQFNEAGDEIWLVAAHEDGSGLRLVSWDMNSSEVKEMQSFDVELPVFMDAILSPDGTLLAVGNVNNEAELLDVATGEQIFILNQYSDLAWAYDFNEDGTQLIVGARNGEINIFDITESLAQNTPQKISTTIRTFDASIFNAHFSPSGKQFFLEFNNNLPTEVWDLSAPAEPQLIRTLPSSRSLNELNHDGSHVLSVVGNGVIMWDMETETDFFTLAWHGQGINSYDFSPDEEKIVTASNDGMVRIWDATLWGGGEVQAAYFEGGGFNVQISPDQRLIGLGGFNNNAYLIDRETLEVVHILAGDGGGVYETAFHPDSSRVATVGADNVIRIWDVNSGEVLLSWTGHVTGTLAGGFFSGVLDVAYSPDGTRLATASSDGTAKVWDAESGTEQLVFEGHTVSLHSIAYSPDGKLIATGSDNNENMARVWDAETGEEIYALQADSRVWGVNFSPDNQLLAATGGGGFVKMWDMRTGTELFHLPSSGGISSSTVLFTPDGKQLVTYSNNVTRVWDVASGEEIKQISNSAHLFSMALTADGRILYGGSSNHGILRAYTLHTEDTIALAESRVTRGLTEAECKEYLHMDACPDD